MDADTIQAGTAVVAVWLFLPVLSRGDAVKPAALCLALVTGGLLWESSDPWMPADLQPVLLKSAVALLGFATAVIVMSMRSGDGSRSGVALIGAAGITGVVLRYDLGEYRSMVILSATVLMVVAAGAGGHILLVRHVLRREEPQAAASVHTLWVTGMTWAVLLSCGLTAWRFETMPRWATLLVATASAAAGIAMLTVGQTVVLMWRHPGFAAAYAVPMSQARIDVRGAMAGGVLLLSPAVPLPGMVRALGGGPDYVGAVTWMSTAFVVIGVWRVMRVIRGEALRQRRNAMAGPAAAGVRELALDDPVYRLLPGVSGRRR
ncbi:hypothetical protein HTV45_17470 [Streptomyces sp. CHD11]|uniref:hypothetical protein n=1 Tax=Streptomyces sp. CHD11 TaxID=2741325 RepID=UPI001BFC9E83|nr:hypothetical protein [Streptomyces sp. CHD11]MBT3152641.1 hypothetical protein [Streptomyces sp. CHD11]